MRLAIGGLFAGIGGFEEGFRRGGHHAAFLCESDPGARRVLEHRFPGVPLVDDVRTLGSLPACDVIAAGFPCTDLSQVGRTEGINGSESGLVKEVFRLLSNAHKRIKWLVLENVPFMLHLHKGAAMRAVTNALEELGWSWAYRMLDSKAFGLPQRRRRIFLIASRTEDPRPALLGQDDGEIAIPSRGRSACGFYWTEGHRGLGWAIDAIPPLKGGSGISIPSPPAIWFPGRQAFFLPSIQDAERLQGFAANWTQPASDATHGDSKRWRLVGNAVSVPVAAWLAERLLADATYNSSGDSELAQGRPWPDAAWGVNGHRAASSVSACPVRVPRSHLASFFEHPLQPLSVKAASGFLARLEHSSLRKDKEFVADMRRYVARERKRMSTSTRRATGPNRTVAKRSPNRPNSVTAFAWSVVDPAVSRRMAATRGRNNPAELELRSAIHKQGFRFRVHSKILPGLRRTADLSFASLRVALFLDGCFWHGCPIHGTWPKHNAATWRDKIETNRARDKDTDQKLKENGWVAIRIWEHEKPNVAVRRIVRVLRSRRKALNNSRR